LGFVTTVLSERHDDHLAVTEISVTIDRKSCDTSLENERAFFHRLTPDKDAKIVLFTTKCSQQTCKYTARFIMFSVITNIYNKKTKGPALMELFTATGKPKKVF
jgi:hypothetical protein